MDLLIILLIILIPAIASIYLNSTYTKYKSIDSKIGISGQEIASKILEENELSDIYVVETPGNLTDHYDSNRKTVRLSKDIFHNNSIASISVAAHECGHAIQDKEKYMWMQIRSLLFPIVKIGTQLAYIVIFIGFIAEALDIVYVGIALISLGLIFQLVTLPVEFNASNRALEELIRLDLIKEEEVNEVKTVLTAAAYTYVASVVVSLLDLIRLILIFTNDKRR